MESLIVSNSKIWMPDVMVYDRVTMDQSTEPPRSHLHHTGSVSQSFPLIVATSCLLNLRYFPFDVQRCKLSFGSWSYEAHVMLIRAAAKRAAEVDYYYRHSEWQLVEFNVSPHVYATHNFNKERYAILDFTIKIRRRSSMLFWMIYAPNLWVNILTIVQFLLPCDSTEKIVIGVNILVAMVLYLLVLAETLPITESVPFVVIYMVTTTVLVTVSLLVTIFILDKHHRGRRGDACHLSERARNVYLHKVATAVGLVKYITPTNDLWKKFSSADERLKMSWSATDFKSQEERILTDIVQRVQQVSNLIALKVYRDELTIEWNQLAMVLGRCMLFIYTFVTVIFWIIIFSAQSYYNGFGMQIPPSF